MQPIQNGSNIPLPPTPAKSDKDEKQAALELDILASLEESASISEALAVAAGIDRNGREIAPAAVGAAAPKDVPKENNEAQEAAIKYHVSLFLEYSSKPLTLPPRISVTDFSFLGGLLRSASEEQLHSLIKSLVSLCPDITDLSFMETRITADTLALLAPLKKLQCLNLSGCIYLTNASLAHLATFSSLKRLVVDNCAFLTDEGLQHLTSLTSLERLELARCSKLTDRGLQHLTALPRLLHLDLNQCSNLTDRGLQHLTALPRLLHLNLNRCSNLTDSGLEHLAALKQLQHLTLGDCELLTDRGLEYLTTLSQLHYLYLMYCPNLTDRGLAPFRDRPDLMLLE